MWEHSQAEVRPRLSASSPPPALVVLLLLCVLAVLYMMVSVWPAVAPSMRPPLPASASRLYPHNLTLPGFARFQYVINSDVCDDGELKFVLIVTSHEGNQAVRAAWRRLLGADELGRLGVRRVFLLGRQSQQPGYASVNQSLVEVEAAHHGDIVQGSFLENYRNLTAKHLMGLQWAAGFCKAARYVIKMDDDIALDVYQLTMKLTERYPPRRLLLGLIHYDMQPVRDRASKWYVSQEEYAGLFYQPFLSGWMYVASQDVVGSLLVAASRRPVFWIDDVHVTGTLAADIGVRHQSLNAYYTPHVQHLECCAREPALRCDYMVGPFGDDEALLADFIGQARVCAQTECARRPTERSVMRTCVGTDKYRHAATGKGTAEVVAVSWGAR